MTGRPSPAVVRTLGRIAEAEKKALRDGAADEPDDWFDLVDGEPTRFSGNEIWRHLYLAAVKLFLEGSHG